MHRNPPKRAQFHGLGRPKAAPWLGFHIDLPCSQGCKIRFSLSFLPIIPFRWTNFSCGEKLWIEYCIDEKCYYPVAGGTYGYIDSDKLTSNQNNAKENCQKKINATRYVFNTSGTNFDCGQELYINYYNFIIQDINICIWRILWKKRIKELGEEYYE